MAVRSFRPTQLGGDTSVGFLRCLYQARSIVLQLERFSTSSRLYQRGQRDDIRAYINTTFNKLLRLFHALSHVLTNMERQHPPSTNRARIASFRNDLQTEWRRATRVYQVLLDRMSNWHLQEASSPSTLSEFSDGSASPWSNNSPLLPTC
ncbi:hypothetical protein O0I10_012009 [Lichtheimia ornata]|uniref:Uncharacterized protein n=1 Tax=Lichtheimia ornata TaxID=688661 RepID=A0AAD7URQ7_9FUNG|nr:uncharacterized protein O0I10_012009 [Lichtheimia ornata]KAJ8652338.1 hypothetical protein O0I10_012009 [Lichtheimia ornata]